MSASRCLGWSLVADNFVLTYGSIPFTPTFFYLDREPYVADRIFIEHKLRVHFKNDFTHDAFPYDVVVAWVWPWQVERFKECMGELRVELSAHDEDFELACECLQKLATDAS